jgi:DNA-binding beta-propeller fold protein YncE
LLRRIILITATAAVAPYAAGAQASVAERFGDIRDASGRGDHALALALSDSLWAVAPGHPNVVLTRAVALAAAGRDDQAIEAVRVLLRWDARYALRALQDSTLAPLRGRLGADVDALAAADALPLARGAAWATIDEPDLVAEGTAWDPATRSFLVGSLHKNKVVAVAEDGTVSDRVSNAGLGSVVGIHVDAPRGILWVASNPRFDEPADTTTPALFAFEAATGRFVRRVDAPRAGFLNDITSGADGTVYVTDSRSAQVWALVPDSEALAALTQLGPVLAPNGITVSPDGRLLFVADYDHVRVLSLETGESWRLIAPDSVNLAGIDGLAHAGDALVAHHPLAFWRIARYRLDADARRIVGVDFFEWNTPDARTSTTGEVVGDWYYYVGNGQLDRMNQRSIDVATMEPIRLYRTPLFAETEASLVAVALSGADSVALLDGRSLERLTTIAVGAGPHEIAPSADRRTLYVADAGDSSVTVLALSPRPHVAATWRLPDGIRVHDVAPDEGGVVWAVSGEPAVLLGLEAASGRVLRRHPLRRPGSWMLEARGPAITVANLEGGAVTLFDPATGTETVLEGREGEIDAAATPDGSRVWSVNYLTGELTVYDVATGAQLTRRPAGAQPSRVAFTPDGRRALVVLGGESRIAAYDVATVEVVASVDVPSGPKVIAVRSDGRLAYVTHPDGALTLIDVPSMTVLRTVPLSGTPDGVAIGLDAVRPSPPSGHPAPSLLREGPWSQWSVMISSPRALNMRFSAATSPDTSTSSASR